jgi:hypothetical protein
MDKRRIAAMLPAVSARVPVAARGQAVDPRGGKDCCSKDAVGRPARAASRMRAKPLGNPGGRGPLLQLPRRLCGNRKPCTACRNGPDMTSGEV